MAAQRTYLAIDLKSCYARDCICADGGGVAEASGI